MTNTTYRRLWTRLSQSHYGLRGTDFEVARPSEDYWDFDPRLPWVVFGETGEILSRHKTVDTAKKAAERAARKKVRS
jgi:hypothetical protein